MVASELESRGNNHDLNGADEIVDSLEREFEALKHYIKEKRIGGCSPGLEVQRGDVV